MSSEEAKPLIDFSHAKEPPQSIKPTDKEAAPIDEPTLDTENIGEQQIIIANIPNGGNLPSQKENLP